MTRKQAAETRYSNLRLLWEKEREINAELLEVAEEMLRVHEADGGKHHAWEKVISKARINLRGVFEP